MNYKQRTQAVLFSLRLMSLIQNFLRLVLFNLSVQKLIHMQYEKSLLCKNYSDQYDIYGHFFDWKINESGTGY